MSQSLPSFQLLVAQAGYNDKVERNANQSTAFVLPMIEKMVHEKPDLYILDVGTGIGTIAASFARMIPEGKVVGIDVNADVLPKPRHIAAYNLKNVDFHVASVHKMPYADNTFDVVFCDQVLVWTPRQWEVLAEMLRVTKPGGIVAAREEDFETNVIWPPISILQGAYHTMVADSMKACGGSNTAGRKLLSWAMRAGAKRNQIQLSFSALCNQEPDERKAWSQRIMSICRKGMIRDRVLETGAVTENELEEMIEAWKGWASCEDASLAMMHGEIIIQKEIR